MTDKTLQDNPLLDFSGLPRFADIRAEHVGPAIERKIGPGAFSAMALDADWRTARWAAPGSAAATFAMIPTGRARSSITTRAPTLL